MTSWTSETGDEGVHGQRAHGGDEEAPGVVRRGRGRALDAGERRAAVVDRGARADAARRAPLEGEPPSPAHIAYEIPQRARARGAPTRRPCQSTSRIDRSNRGARWDRPTTELDAALRDFIERQHVFFVATAPSGRTATSTARPRASTRSASSGPTTVAYLDFAGSGAETIAHLRENGRIVMMFCAFEGPPKIVRLHGRGEVARAGRRGVRGAARALRPGPRRALDHPRRDRAHRRFVRLRRAAACASKASGRSSRPGPSARAETACSTTSEPRTPRASTGCPRCGGRSAASEGRARRLHRSRLRFSTVFRWVPTGATPYGASGSRIIDASSAGSSPRRSS